MNHTAAAEPCCKFARRVASSSGAVPTKAAPPLLELIVQGGVTGFPGCHLLHLHLQSLHAQARPPLRANNDV
jgi:hypothetical protein